MAPPRVLSGKVCLVTGATSGIGAATARALAARGATVIVAGRDPARCARRAAALERAGGAAVPLVADLASQREVRDLAATVARRFARLDVLVNGAGATYRRRTLTADGVERTLAVNHLAPFLLTGLLLPCLAASPSARVVNVCSAAHARATLDLDDLQGARRWERVDAYARSKLALLLFTYALARRLEGTRVTANAVDPGLAATRLGADAGWLRYRLRNLLRPGLASADEAARTVVWAAASPELEGRSGRYLRACAEARSSARSLDAALAERLWAASARLTALAPAIASARP